jgi:excisionase family DNA binding protein
MHKTSQDSVPAALRPDEAHAIIGTNNISRRAFYNALHRGEIPNLRLGRRIIIPRAAFIAWLNCKPTASSRP